MFFAVTHTQKQERILLASTFGRLSYSDTVAQELTLRLKKKRQSKTGQKTSKPNERSCRIFLEKL